MKNCVFIESDITETIGVIFLAVMVVLAGLLNCFCGENGVLSEGLYYESPSEKVNLSAIYEASKEGKIEEVKEVNAVNGA